MRTVMKSTFAVVLTIALGLLSACAADGPSAPHAEVQKPPTKRWEPISPPTGLARVTFFRESHFVGGGTQVFVKIAGIDVGTVSNGTVLSLNYAPGDYEITFSTFMGIGHASLPIHLDSGAQYYVEVGTSGGGALAGGVMVAIPGSMNDGQNTVDRPHCGGGACAIQQPPSNLVGRLDTLNVVAPEPPAK